jgi:hypothetical protein
MKAKPSSAVVIIGALGLLASGFASAQSLQRVLDSEARRIQQAQASQERIDDVVQATRGLNEEYKAVNKEIDGLVVYNTLLDRQIANQNTELTQLRQSIDDVSIIERQILPLMTRMIDGLEQFVELDVPFLLDGDNGRRARVSGLQTLLERSDVTAAEKFRKVMEAWQIENDFGRTIEAYTTELEIDGTNREVEMLRIGRVALMYQTPDGELSGAWDQKSRSWVPLGSEFRNQVRSGLRMAKKQTAPDLLMLPIAAPEEG